MAAIFITGFPGFLGSAMIERLLGRDAESIIVALVQPKFARLAQERVARLAERDRSWPDRVRLVEGDITQASLGLNSAAWQTEVEEVYHFAAVYDLSVPRVLGMKINVNGTRQVARFAEKCPKLQRMHYISTCYVSGCYEGVFREADLDVGQRFNNYYEETKFLAEVEVQSAMQSGLAATIYRPAIVVGDSRTGATQKYDGPYYFLQWLLRWRGIAPTPVIGKPKQHRVNMVPRDFVVDALDALSQKAETAGQVYHLCDPAPATVWALLHLFGRAAGRWVLPLPLPAPLAKQLLIQVPLLRQWLRIPPEALDYFIHPTRYASDHALRDLEGTGIQCPPVSSYIDRLVAFMRAHPEITATAMR